MDVKQLVESALPFLTWLGDWKAALPTFELAKEIGDPAQVAVISVDVTNGFCYEGPLSSPRVGSIVPPIERLFRRAHELGVRDFVLSKDTHETVIRFAPPLTISREALDWGIDIFASVMAEFEPRPVD